MNTLDQNVKLALDHHILLTPVQPRSKQLVRPVLTIESFDQWEAAKDTFGADIGAAVHLHPSDLCVVDLDRRDGLALLSRELSLPMTMAVQTARGFHLYFRRPGETLSGEVILDGDHDLGQYLCGNHRWQYALLPGSTHPTGWVYRWLTLPSVGIALLPADLQRFVYGDNEPYVYPYC